MKRIRLLLPGLFVLALWGCGGGSDSKSAGNALTNGRAELNRLAAGEEPADAKTLEEILNLFQEAIREEPTSTEAYFGAAVCMTGLVTAEAYGPDTPLPPAPPEDPNRPRLSDPALANDGPIPPAPPGYGDKVRPAPSHRLLGLIWNLDRGLSNPFVLLTMLGPVTDLRMGLIPYYGYYGDDPERRLKMLERLNTVVQHLEKVEADPNFTTTLRVRNRDGETVTIGLPEVYLFDAYVNSLRVELALSLAYIRDPGEWVNSHLSGGGGSAGTGTIQPGGTGYLDSSGPRDGGGMPIWSPRFLDRNGDGTLTPDEYLPPSPFLTLRDPNLLKTAQQAMLAVAEKAAKGIEGVLQRPEDGKFLITNDPDTRQALTQIRDAVLPVIRQAATGPVTFEVPIYEPMPLAAAMEKHWPGSSAARRPTRKVFEYRPVEDGDQPPDAPDHPFPQPKMVKVTLNLAAWFANPPSDLKAFAPTFPLSEDGWPLLDRARFPDPTFGGLFPEGLPARLWMWV